jgi:hypothetical protein
VARGGEFRAIEVELVARGGEFRAIEVELVARGGEFRAVEVELVARGGEFFGTGRFSRTAPMGGRWGTRVRRC